MASSRHGTGIVVGPSRPQAAGHHVAFGIKKAHKRRTTRLGYWRCLVRRMCGSLTTSARIEHFAPDPMEEIVDCLKKDGLTDQASHFDKLFHHVAWTTGTEMLGEIGPEMKRMWPLAKGRGSQDTKENIKAAAGLIRESWRLFRL